MLSLMSILLLGTDGVLLVGGCGCQLYTLCLLTNRDKMSTLYRGPTKLQFIWESTFRGEDFLEINQSERRMACAGHVCF